MELTVELKKKFVNFEANINFTAKSGITILFGRSGCGKTTTLKMIAGLIQPDSGTIKLEDEVIFEHATRINLTPQQRKFGFVYQEHALFPHLNILQNIAFGAKDFGKKEQRELVLKKIRSFRLEGQEEKFPHEISGGQQQRAALARAIIGNPRVLLLDEPFSAIDGPNRLNMRECLKRVMQRLNLPIILVTHDLNEAFSTGDQILIFENGRIIQQGTPLEIAQNPACNEVKALINPLNFQAAKVFSNTRIN